MSDEQTERRAEARGRELGEITTKLKFLEDKTVQIAEKIDAGFAGLECKKNTEQIHEMFGWYQQHKANTATVRSTLLKSFVSSVAGGLLVLLGFKIQ